MNGLNDKLYRVKVYKCDEDGNWIEEGIGHCYWTVDNYQPGFFVRSEQDTTAILLNVKVDPKEVFEKQQETLIVWTEPSTGETLSLSFQHAQGCTMIWEKICAYQSVVNGGPALMFSEDNTVLFPENDGVRAEFHEAQTLALPSATIANLPVIVQLIEKCAAEPALLVRAVLKTHYVDKLLDVFEACEDLEVEQDLQDLFRIFAALILMHDYRLCSVLFADERIMRVIGVLEYDPALPAAHRTAHREHLRTGVVFRTVLPLKPRILSRIHLAFRIRYIKDVILNNMMTDQAFNSFITAVFYNHLEIVRLFLDEQDFFKVIVGRLRAPAADTSTGDANATGNGTDEAAAMQSRIDAAEFLQQLTSLSRKCVMDGRNQFLGMVLYCVELHNTFTMKLVKHGVLDAFEECLESGNVRLQKLMSEIVGSLMIFSASGVRKHITAQKDDQYTFLTRLVTCMVNSGDVDVALHCQSLLEALMESDPTSEQDDANEFLNVLYHSNILRMLLPPLRAKTSSRFDATLKNSICEILIRCANNHSYRMRFFIVGQAVLEHVRGLLAEEETFLKIAAVRTLRAIIGMKDEFCNKHIIKNRLFEPLMAVFVANGNRYNVLNSAIIELLEFIVKWKTKLFVNHLVDKYAEKLRFKDIDYVDTFQKLLVVYEQQKEIERRKAQLKGGGGAADASADGDGDGAARDRQGDAEEEAYFNESSDEAPMEDASTAGDGSSAAASSTARGGEKESVAEAASPQRELPSIKSKEEDEEVDLTANSRVKKPEMAKKGMGFVLKIDHDLPRTATKASAATLAALATTSATTMTPAVDAPTTTTTSSTATSSDAAAVNVPEDSVNGGTGSVLGKRRGLSSVDDGAGGSGAGSGSPMKQDDPSAVKKAKLDA